MMRTSGSRIILGLIMLLPFVGEISFAAKSCDQLYVDLPSKQKVSQQQVLLDAIRLVEKDLKGQKNPFDNITFDLDKIREVHLQLTRSLPVYAEILKFSNSRSLDKITYDKFEKELLSLVKNRTTLTVHQKYALVESLRLLSQKEAEIAIEEMNKKIEEQKEEQKKQDQQKQEDQKQDEQKSEEKSKQEDQEPQNPWQQRNDQYKPHNKDIANSDAGSKPQVILMTNAPVDKGLFGDIYFDVVTVKGIARNPSVRPKLLATTKTGQVEIIRTFGNTEISILLESGVVPKIQKNEDFEIREIATGEFTLFVHNTSLKEVTFEVESARQHEALTTQQMGVYAAKSGIKLEDWPHELQSKITELKQSTSQPLVVAKALEKFIAEEASFLYYSKGDKLKGPDLQVIDQKFEEFKKIYPEPVALTHAGAFNCDGAAWIGTLILREYFGIPARVVQGRGSKQKVSHNGQIMNAITSSAVLHQWVEIFVGGEWHAFDFTPRKNPPDRSQSPSDEKLIDEQDQQPKPPKDKKEDQESDSEKSDGGKEKESKKEEKESEEKSEEKKSEEEKAKEKEEEGKEEKESLISTEDLLKNKSSELPPDRILDRATFEQATLYHLEKILQEGSPAKVAEMLNRHLSGMLANEDYAIYAKKTGKDIQKVLFQLAGSQIQKIRPWLMTVQNHLMKGQLESAWTELASMRNLVIQVRKNNKLSKEEAELIRIVDQILNELKALKHPNAAQHKVVKDFYRLLPGGISKRLILKTYGDDALVLGSPSQLRLANDLVAGKLNRYLLMSLLNKYADFILSADIVNQWADVKTLQKSPTPKKNMNDLVLTRNPLDFPRMILNPDPGEHVFAKTFQGKQFALNSRETVKQPDPKRPLERKVSVILYDLSSSMSGEKAQIQDAIMMAFVDKALSEVDAFGRPTHEVYLYGFHDFVLEGEPVKTAQQAEDYIQSKVFKASEPNGGTNIEKALVQFYTTVAEHAHRKSKDKIPLDRANLILLTDGGSTVNEKVVEDARALVPKNIKINLNFLAIQSTNAAIVKLAADSNSKRKESMVKELNSELIAEIMGKLRAPELDQDAFATTAKTASAQTMQWMSRLVALKVDSSVRSLEIEITKLQTQLGYIEHDMKKVRSKELLELKRLTELLEAQTQFDRELRQRIVYQLLSIYPTHSGRALNSLTVTEYKLLNALVKWSLH